MSRLDPAPHCQPLSPALRPPVWAWRQDWRPHLTAASAVSSPPSAERADPVEPAPAAPPARLGPQAAIGVQLARASLEVLNGQRPLEQLEDWFDETALAGLRARIGPCRRAGGVKLLNLRVQTPHPGAAEVSLSLGWGGHRLAGLLAVNRRGSGWLCTDWRLLGGPGGAGAIQRDRTG